MLEIMMTKKKANVNPEPPDGTDPLSAFVTHLLDLKSGLSPRNARGGALATVAGDVSIVPDMVNGGYEMMVLGTSSSSRIQFDSGGLFPIGQDFSIDGYFRLTAASGIQYIFDYGANIMGVRRNSQSWQIARAAALAGSVNRTVVLDQNTYFCFERVGTAAALYIDNTRVWTAAWNIAVGHATLLYVGNYGANGYPLQGAMKRFRVTRGASRWAAATTITPPALNTFV